MRATTAIRLMAVGAWVCGVACGALGASTVTAALSRQQSKPPVKARLLLRVGDKDATVGSEVTLLGRDADVLLAQDSQSGAAVSRIDKARVVRCEFIFDYDRSVIATSLQNNDWAAAVRTLSPAARLALPYLDLADNNGLELVLDLGVYMMSSADREMRSSSTNNVASRELAFKQYEAAYDVFRQAGKAVWSPLGQVAILKGCHALLAQNKDAQATEAFGQIDEPSPGDATFGHYWLVQAELLRHAGKTRDALDAVVKSVVFANKDADTFPSALLLSADCYAQLGQYHRARDIYYEVAVLFVGTDWAVDALAGLKIIMDGKKTTEKEKAPLENVFFKVSDDMNKLSEELLSNRNQPKPKKGAAGAKDTE